MKKLSLILVFALLAAVLLPTTAFGYNAIQGQVIDTENSQPWVWGGNVWVVGSTSGVLAGPVALAGDGTYNIAIAPVGPETIDVIIDFSVATSPEGTPGTNTDCSTTNVAIPIPFNCGYVETGTGENAIVLSNLTAASGSSWVAFAMVFGAVAVVGGGLLVARKRK